MREVCDPTMAEKRNHWHVTHHYGEARFHLAPHKATEQIPSIPVIHEMCSWKKEGKKRKEIHQRERIITNRKEKSNLSPANLRAAIEPEVLRLNASPDSEAEQILLLIWWRKECSERPRINQLSSLPLQITATKLGAGDPLWTRPPRPPVGTARPAHNLTNTHLYR